MNYEKQASELQESNWLKLEEGKHRVTPLTDMSEPVTATKNIKGEMKELTQSELGVEYMGKRYTWSVTKAKTPTSTWGQLVRLGKAYGSLVGKPLDIVVKGSGQNKDYTILQVLDLVKDSEL